MMVNTHVILEKSPYVVLCLLLIMPISFYIYNIFTVIVSRSVNNIFHCRLDLKYNIFTTANLCKLFHHHHPTQPKINSDFLVFLVSDTTCVMRFAAHQLQSVK